VLLLCRSVAELQRDLGAQASPSRKRSPVPKVVAELLTEDARTATPPPRAAEKKATSPLVADSRMASPPCAVDAGAGGAVGDIGTPASPGITDVDPISSRPAGTDDDLVKDQPQIDQAPRGLGTSGAQVPDSSSSSPRLPRREIDWNNTPWQDDIFEDNEDMQTLRTSIVTINHALMVGLLTMYFSDDVFVEVSLTSLLCCGSPWQNRPKAGLTC
jgi:hypothetical protein